MLKNIFSNSFKENSLLILKLFLESIIGVLFLFTIKLNLDGPIVTCTIYVLFLLGLCDIQCLIFISEKTNSK